MCSVASCLAKAGGRPEDGRPDHVSARGWRVPIYGGGTSARGGGGAEQAGAPKKENKRTHVLWVCGQFSRHAASDHVDVNVGPPSS